MARNRKLMGCVLAVAASAALPAAAYTSASYVQDGLVSQWDAIDNEGTGVHNPSATVWKDLKGNRDLTLQGNGAWRRGLAFYTSGPGAVGTNAAPKYLTIEVLCKVANGSARILFWSGNDRARYVLFDHNLTSPYCRGYFDGSAKSETVKTPYTRVKRGMPVSLVATYDNADNVTGIVHDGVQRAYDTMYNGWNPGHTGIVLGDRKTTSNYPWTGEIYSIRLYDRVLTPEEIARNYQIDVKRFYTTAMYEKDGMVAFWDALDNVGQGVHDSTTNTWKNLIDGGQDLTLNNSTWGDNALLCNGGTKSGAYGTNTLALNSLEVLYRYERPDDGVNAWLFSNGIDRYCVLANQRLMWQDWYGVYSSTDWYLSFTHGGMHAAGWTNPDPGATTNAYIDGELSSYGGKDGTIDYWGVGNAYVGVGGRSSGGQNFKGRIYAVRAYSTLPDVAKMRENYKIDRERYANPMRWKGTDGTFGTPGSWCAIDPTQAIPGVDNTAVLPCGTYKVTLDANQTVAALSANNGNVSRMPHLNATLDMGGHTLTVLGEYASESTWGTSSRFSRVTLTNGTFKAETAKIGAIHDVIFCEPNVLAQDVAFGCGSGTLIVEGSGTTVSVRKYVDLYGPFTRLRVGGGANFTCDRLRAYSMQYHGTSYAPGVYDRAQIEITGSGTVVSLGALSIHRDVDVLIGDGADVTVRKSAENFSSMGWISCIGRSCERYHGNSSRMVVDNATLRMTCTGFAVGASHNGSGGSGTSMTLRNGATLVVTNVSRFAVGASRNGQWGVGSNATNSIFEVQDGATFLGAATTRLEAGAGGHSSFNGIVVSNATVTCGAIYLGLLASGTYSYYSSNDYLRVAGPATRIAVSGTAADSIRVRMGSRLAFTLPENGYAATPLTTAGGVTVMADEDVMDVDPVKLVIDPSAFDAERKGRKQTLLACATDSTESLQRLVDNVEFVNAARYGTVTIEDGGTRLVYNGLAGGTSLILR